MKIDLLSAFPLAVVLLLGACGHIPPATKSAPSWACSPINPAMTTLPDAPCFRASYLGQGAIELAWEVVNSSDEVYIYDNSARGNPDVGYRAAVCEGGACATRVHMPTGGTYRWQLAVNNDIGTIHVPAELDVAPLLPPSVSGGGIVDALAPTDQTFSWRADPRNDKVLAGQASWIETFLPSTLLLPDKRPRLPLSGPDATFTVDREILEQAGGLNYQVRECSSHPGAEQHFCSSGTPVSFLLDSDRFLVSDPLYTRSTRENLQIRFTTHAGDERRLSSATLLPDGPITTGKSAITIEARYLRPGKHWLALKSCKAQSDTCSRPRTLQVLVEQPIDWELERDYTLDFYPGSVYNAHPSSEPLDITFDDSGAVWMSGEFSREVVHLTAAGEVEVRPVPLARKEATYTDKITGAELRRRETVKPFATAFFSSPTAANFSGLGESAVWDGERAWFTQGGGMIWIQDSGLTVNNHSRVIAIDPNARDLPTTATDDRFCIYNIPSDAPQGVANNQVIGLVPAFGRIWIAESRGLLGDGERPSAISSFVPDPALCHNLLDYSDPQAIRNQALQYCLDGEYPETHGCIETVILNDFPPGLKLAHLSPDPQENIIWFVDARGRFLGSLSPGEAQPVRLYPLPDSHRYMEIYPGPAFGGFPWSLQATEDAVYFVEYFSGDVVRFDKSSKTFHEIHVPLASYQMTPHTMEIDPVTDRLWFSIAIDHPVALPDYQPTIAYIDLGSWRNHLGNPDSDEPIRGVVYAGLETLADSPFSPSQRKSFTGLAIDPGTGKIALSTMRRKQITLLQPRKAFRPLIPAGNTEKQAGK